MHIDVMSDHVKMVRDRPKIYAAVRPLLPWLALHMVRDIVLLGGKAVSLNLKEPWAAICADQDWLRSPNGMITKSPFYQMMRIEAAVHDDMRGEILINAFETAVVTDGVDGITWIRGSEATTLVPAEIAALARREPGGRTLLFSLDEANSPHLF